MIDIFKNENTIIITSWIFAIGAIVSAIYLIVFSLKLITQILSTKKQMSKNNSDFENSMESVKDGVYKFYSINNRNIVGRKGDCVFDIGISSVQGSRQYQQDAVIATDNTTIKKMNTSDKCAAALCDGMGGLEGGELASALSVRLFYDSFVMENPRDIPMFFKNIIKKMDIGVKSLKDNNNNALEAGSTFVGVIIDNLKLYWASVGDSRIYIIRDNNIIQITTDQNYFKILKEKADKGIITIEEALSNPQAGALISFIGNGEKCEPDICNTPIQLNKGDTVLLCSDGLYKMLANDTIKELVKHYSNDASVAANALTSAALAVNKKSHDNASVAVINIL